MPAKRKWVTTNLSSVLYNQIEKDIINNPDTIYRSVNEFVIECVRRGYMDELERLFAYRKASRKKLD